MIGPLLRLFPPNNNKDTLPSNKICSYTGMGVGEILILEQIWFIWPVFSKAVKGRTTRSSYLPSIPHINNFCLYVFFLKKRK